MEQQVVEYSVTDAAVAEMSDLYMPLVIVDLEDKGQLTAVHNARMVVKGKRVEVEKARKELKKEALAYGKQVDSEAKRIFGLLEPIETHLKDEEDKVAQEQARLKAEEERKLKALVEERIGSLLEYRKVLSFADVAAMSDEEFDTALFDAQEDYKEQQRIKAEQAEARKAEEERLARQRREQEAEAERLAEQEAKAQTERNRIASEQKAAQDKLDAERKVLEAEVAQLREKQRAKEWAERKALEKKEAEEQAAAEATRQEALKPDKGKLTTYLEAIQLVMDSEIELASDEAKEFREDLDSGISGVISAYWSALEML